MVTAAITGFMNVHRYYNDYSSNSGSPHKNGSNMGVNIQSASIANCPEQMGGQNANNRDGMNKISCGNFRNIIN